MKPLAWRGALPATGRRGSGYGFGLNGALPPCGEMLAPNGTSWALPTFHGWCRMACRTGKAAALCSLPSKTMSPVAQRGKCSLEAGCEPETQRACKDYKSAPVSIQRLISLHTHTGS